jgi:CBS domain-containing protein
MSKPVVTLPAAATLGQAAELMMQSRIGSIVVVDAVGKTSGIVTERSFPGRHAHLPFSRDSLTKVFGEWLDADGLERVFAETRDVPLGELAGPATCIEPDSSAEDAIEVMLRADVNHVVVVADGRPVGMVSRRDLLKLLVANATRG